MKFIKFVKFLGMSSELNRKDVKIPKRFQLISKYLKLCRNPTDWGEAAIGNTQKFDDEIANRIFKINLVFTKKNYGKETKRSKYKSVYLQRRWIILNKQANGETA